MGKRIIISENMFNKIMLSEALSKSEIADIIKSDEFKNAIKNNKELEKKMKNLIGDSIETLARTLWQRTNFWKDTITKK